MRRVVTGHSSDGKSIVASDEEVAPARVDLLPGYAWYRLWSRPDAPDFFPPEGAHRFLVFEVPPDSVRRPPVPEGTSLFAELEKAVPGMAPHMERDGMHRTRSVDYGYVVAGEVLLELDGGQKVRLRAGDTYVQNGTRHAWRNDSAHPCRIAVVLVGVP